MQHLPADLCNEDLMFPVRYKLNFYILLEEIQSLQNYASPKGCIKPKPGLNSHGLFANPSPIYFCKLRHCYIR